MKTQLDTYPSTISTEPILQHGTIVVEYSDAECHATSVLGIATVLHPMCVVVLSNHISLCSSWSCLKLKQTWNGAQGQN